MSYIMTLNQKLGYACRCGTLEEVKALVESGAALNLDDSRALWYRDNNGSVRDADYSLALIDDIDAGDLGIVTGKISPIDERLKIAEYLLDCAEQVKLNPERLLYYALDCDCVWLYELLKKRGVSFSEELKKYVAGRDVDYVKVLETIEHFRFMLREVGLELIDKYMSYKTDLLEYFIDNDAADLIAAVEPYGWLDNTNRLQELIAYAADNKKIECAACLLQFKHERE